MAIFFLLLADSFFALAFPPFNPPLRPISARYSDMGDRLEAGAFAFCKRSGSSSVDRLTISAANRLGSLGSLLREPVMHSNIAHYQPMSTNFWKELFMNWNWLRLFAAAIFTPSKVKRATHNGPLERGPEGTTQVRGDNGIFASKRADPPKTSVNRQK